MAACLLAQMHQEKAIQMLRQKKGDIDQVNNFMDQAYALYRQASLNATEDMELSYIYYKWAVWYAVGSDFEAAWEKVELSKKHGGEFIDPKFVELLSQQFPPPQKELLEDPLFDELTQPQQKVLEPVSEETPEGALETQ